MTTGRGGFRTGAGRPPGAKNKAPAKPRVKKRKLVTPAERAALKEAKAAAAKESKAAAAPMERPQFETWPEYAMWALNAPDNMVSVDQKIQVLKTMAHLDLKAMSAKATGKNRKADEKDSRDAAMATGKWAPRVVAP